MNKIGDFLTLIKEVQSKNKNAGPEYFYTFGQKYQIMHIKNDIYYISNNETRRNKEEIFSKTDISEEEKTRKILKTCSIWSSEQMDEYFVNISEQRKEKIKKIKKIYDI
jgi:hypothetical protein